MSSVHETIRAAADGPVLTITLHRPDCCNAMNSRMVSELQQLLADTALSPDCRVIVLRGADGNFCAGGDVKDMAAARAQMTDTYNPYEALNRQFGTLIEQANHQPQTLLCVLEGAVLGGGFGLACVSDVAIAHSSARFGLPETTLGVIPAQIAPFVVERIGLTRTRRLALLGERLTAQEALAIGLIHEVAEDTDTLDSRLQSIITQALRCAPQASRQTKALLHRAGREPLSTLLDDAARQFSNAVISEEAREGTLAFVQKRPATWYRQPR